MDFHVHSTVPVKALTNASKYFSISIIIIVILSFSKHRPFFYYDPVYLVNAIKAYRDNHGRVDEADMPERTDAQIENLAAYYSGQPLESSLQGELSVQDMAAKCNRCHAPESGTRKLNVPSLSGQSYDYLVKSMREYRQEDRDNSMMHKMSARYSDEMIEAIAAHYASQ